MLHICKINTKYTNGSLVHSKNMFLFCLHFHRKGECTQEYTQEKKKHTLEQNHRINAIIMNEKEITDSKNIKFH